MTIRLTGDHAVTRRRPLGWRRLVHAIGVVFLFVVGLELTLRLAGAIRSSRLVGGAPSGGAFTIVCIGDSWTEGQSDETRYPDILRERLAARHDGVHYRVVNLGQSGSNSSQAVRRLASHLAELRPTVVLAMTGNNDHWNLTDSTYWEFQDGELGRGALVALRARLFVRSLRVVRLAEMIAAKPSGGATVNEFLRSDESSAERATLARIDQETHRRQLTYNLTRLVELARDHGFTLVLMDYFHLHGYHVEDVIGDVAVTYGVPYVENALRFHTQLGDGVRESYLIPDGHPNRQGYEFMVDGIVEKLDELGLLARK